MKVLNLYAGIGGNRKLWKDVEVTAIENNPEIAKIYQEIYYKDKVIVADAREYLLEHYREYDFIWVSPPCQSHSRARFWASVGINPKYKTYKAIFPDFSLYEIIVFLQHFYKGLWVVENVISYYKPLIQPTKLGKHYFWSNFPITGLKQKLKSMHFGKNQEIADNKQVNLQLLNGLKHRKDQILRNTMNPEIGLYVFNEALKNERNSNKYSDSR